MAFTYSRIVRLADTDAAGVVYFPKMLSICHEAYEQSLAEAGINLQEFFDNTSTAIPIVHAEVDFYRPLFCGNQLVIYFTPLILSENSFEIMYQIVSTPAEKELLAKANTKHVCINPVSRKRIPLPEVIIEWLNK